MEESLEHIEHDGQVLHANQDHKVVDVFTKYHYLFKIYKVNINEVIFMEESLKYIEHAMQIKNIRLWMPGSLETHQDL